MGCRARVHNSGHTVTFRACRFPGPVRNGYCPIHHPEARAKRDLLAQQRFERKQKADPLRIALTRVVALEREVRRLKRRR